MSTKTKSYRPVLVMAPGVLAGAEKVVLTGAAALFDLGHNPLMVIIRETRAPKFALDFDQMLPAHIERTIIDSTKALDLQLPYRLRQVLLKQNMPLILHSHGFKALIACHMARGDSPLVHTHHGNTAHTFKVRIYEKIAMLTMKSCDCIIAVSIQMKKELEKSLQPYHKIEVIENMLSLKNVETIRQQKAKNQNEKKDHINLIYIGRISPEKGLLPFVECLAAHPKKDHFRLTVLGDGVQRTQLETFINEHKLDEQIKLYGFVINPSDYLINADVLIMPSLREGLPMTLIESLSSGVPVIASDVGAISSLIIHQHNGYLVKERTSKNWAVALDEVVNHNQTWKQAAVQEALSVEQRFSAKHWADKTSALYQKLINGQ